MYPSRIHARIIRHAFADLMQGARLDSYHENEEDLSLDVQGLEISSSELIQREGSIFERITCRYVPVGISFFNVSLRKRSGFFRSLEDYPLDDPSRTIAVLYSWQESGKRDIFHLLGLHGPIEAELWFDARRVEYERGEPGAAFTLERDWSPAPPWQQRLVPQPHHLYRQFGGDPITIKVDEKVHRRKLFIGGVQVQPEDRPPVDAVLNVGEEPSKWWKIRQPHPADRWDNKGEGSEGMNAEVIREEANWVIERLQKNQRVLVHCAAGMNRSSTICCAVLILLEGLTAEAALQRVREHHPWAKPDSHHWLALRWLEKQQKE
jgi:hypothetical protein